MALRSVMCSRIPMVVILGATGTGKTKLGVEIAQKFGTEIISADSMQIYKGLDVVTAKASAKERAMAPHHLLDILEPHQMFTVVDFRNRALKIIDNLLEQGKIPIIVGGTNYYIESIVYQILVEDMDDDQALLWDKSRRKRDFDEPEIEQVKKVALDTNKDSNTDETDIPNTSKETKNKYIISNVEDKDGIKTFVDNEKNYTSEDVHLQLKAIDPVMAARLHPNNRRKVLRLLAEWVHFPATDITRRRIATGFEEKFVVPNILGLIDCTHVRITPPAGPQGAQYKNRRKDAHTINVQLIVDSDCRIISVNARYPGRVHDAFIWRYCAVRQEMKRLHDNHIGEYFLLGDSGYPLEPWLLTPIANAGQNSAEANYTNWHCRVRNAVERTNGYLKGSLRCLGGDRILHYAPEMCSEIIYACCIIYNLMKHFGSIEVFLKSGRRHSEVLAEQKQREGELRRAGSTIILWLKCEQAVHDARLNSRVDKMIEDGLIAELLDFHERHNQHRIKDGTPPDYTKGIFQTLGFKEFHNYLMLSPEERESQEGKKLLEDSIEDMKRATRRYARRQNKTVRGRFLEHPNRQVPPIYELDTTDVSKWDENVKNKAIDIIQSYINDSTCTYQPLQSKLSQEARSADGNSHNYCEVCERLILGDNVYAIHLKSNRHMRMLKKKKKIEKAQKIEDL